MLWLRIEPVDVFCARGNKLFGEAGSFGTVCMPPWASVFAGAIRSWILFENGCDPNELLMGKLKGEIAKVLGNGIPTGRVLDGGVKEFAVYPGQLRLKWVSLCKDREIIVPLPRDVFKVGMSEEHPDKKSRLAAEISMKMMRPQKLPSGIRSSLKLPMAPVKAQKKPSKEERDLWITFGGLKAYLRGETLPSESAIRSEDLWCLETRVGIGMDSSARTVGTGKLFTTEAVRFEQGVSFLVGLEGAEGLVPESGLVRLGGDGRGGWAQRVTVDDPTEAVPLDKICRTGRFRLILSSPGIFLDGWIPFGVSQEDYSVSWNVGDKKMKAKLVCAAVDRHEVVSGWDLAREQPKPAHKVVPAWSVYWFEEAQGDVREVLDTVVRGGLWEVARQLWESHTFDESTLLWRERRAEGFNNVLVGAWPEE